MAVDSVRTDVIFGVGRQARDVAGIASRARTATEMAAAGGRIVAGAPTDTSFSHCGTAVIGHIAASLGGGLSDVGNLGGDHRWQVSQSCQRLFTAVGGSLTVGGVGSHIVFRSRIKSCHLYRKGASTRAAASVCVAYGGIVTCAPTDATLRHRRASVVCHIAAACCSILQDAGRCVCGHSRQFGVGGEFLLLSISQALCVLGVGTYIVLGSRYEAIDRNGEQALACAAIGMVASNGRAGLCTPANAPFSHHAATLIGHIAMAFGRRSRNVVHF